MAIDKDGRFIPDEIYSSRRFGRVDIAKQFYECDHDIVSKVFSMMIPTNVSYDYEMEIFRIVGMSESFDAVPLGEQIPYYLVLVSKDAADNATVTFKKS